MAPAACKPPKKKSPAHKSDRLVKQTAPRRDNCQLGGFPTVTQWRHSSRTCRVLASTVSRRASLYVTEKSSNGSDLRLGPGPSRATVPRPGAQVPLPPRSIGARVRCSRRTGTPGVLRCGYPTRYPCGGRARRRTPSETGKYGKKKEKKKKETREKYKKIKSRPGRRRCGLPAETPDPRSPSPTLSDAFPPSLQPGPSEKPPFLRKEGSLLEKPILALVRAPTSFPHLGSFAAKIGPGPPSLV